MLYLPTDGMALSREICCVQNMNNQAFSFNCFLHFSKWISPSSISLTEVTGSLLFILVKVVLKNFFRLPFDLDDFYHLCFCTSLCSSALSSRLTVFGLQGVQYYCHETIPLLWNHCCLFRNSAKMVECQNQKSQSKSRAMGILEIQRMYLARKQNILHKISQKMPR